MKVDELPLRVAEHLQPLQPDIAAGVVLDAVRRHRRRRHPREQRHADQ
jgi:hypothetical protein